MNEVTEGYKRIETRICALPDDMLLEMLRYVPIKDAVATSTNLRLNDVWENCLIENMSGLDAVYTNKVPYHDDKFLRSLSSAKRLRLFFTISMVAGYNAIKFSRLIEFHFVPDVSVDWLEPLMALLQNSPKLKTLTIETYYQNLEAGLPLSWNQPSCIPECLSSHLEIFGWTDYEGTEDEKQLLAYILANSKCLKTVKISPRATCNLEETQKELEYMPRISTSSQLLISPQMDFSFERFHLCCGTVVKY